METQANSSDEPKLLEQVRSFMQSRRYSLPSNSESGRKSAHVPKALRTRACSTVTC